MVRWTLEPGHTSVEFKVRHMMVTWVRGSLKPVEGNIEFDPEDISKSSVEVRMDAKNLWSGDDGRDEHLKSEDFFHIEAHPTIEFKGDKIEVVGPCDFRVTGNLTLRGVTKEVTLDVEYLGSWNTPFWENGVDKGPKTRAGFSATVKLNRQDFGIKWNSSIDKGGIVVGDDVHLTVDAEAIKD